MGLMIAGSVASGLAAEPKELPPASFVGTREGPGEEYVIGPLDQLTIFVWRNPELGAKVQVRPDGRITTRISPGGPGYLSAEGMEKCRDLAAKQGVGINIHIAEVPGETEFIPLPE